MQWLEQLDLAALALPDLHLNGLALDADHLEVPRHLMKLVDAPSLVELKDEIKLTPAKAIVKQLLKLHYMRAPSFHNILIRVNLLILLKTSSGGLSQSLD